MYRDEEGLVYYDAGMMELDLRELLNLFWRRKWFIVVLVFIALLLSYFISDRMTRIYETSTLVMIKESGADSLFSGQFSLLGASKNKSASYKALMESRMVLDKVIAELGLRDDKGELLPAKALREKHISISSTADTGL
ncbi:MAG TPA: Wzz/FepE/Etk N-terminal domain-containing protein, partial [Halanaerobiales bacterium]|nr:Wzz/FepE/Etk N-terminal domain-containing protein [Halanaerobiales bacterium]